MAMMMGHAAAMDDARSRLIRSLQGSDRPLSELLMPEDWPVLTDETCTLRVLDEDDAKHWEIGTSFFDPDGANRMTYFDAPEEAGAWSGEPTETFIRMQRVQWAVGAGPRTLGIWTLPDDRLVGAVETSSHGSPVCRGTPLRWVTFGHGRTALVAEALTLATGWALENFDPDAVVVTLSDERTDDIDAVEAAGFRRFGQSRPSHSFYRFPPAPALTPKP
jgi:hypothetical protein